MESTDLLEANILKTNPLKNFTPLQTETPSVFVENQIHTEKPNNFSTTEILNENKCSWDEIIYVHYIH